MILIGTSENVVGAGVAQITRRYRHVDTVGIPRYGCQRGGAAVVKFCAKHRRAGHIHS